uniref:Uncharacterized protein n=1 Tax=Arabis nemorensis TaxID=586526 RepID=A0A565CR50_9BRAS
MTRTRSKSLKNKFNMLVEQLDREGLIRLDQFEGLQLTPSENSHLTDIFNKASLSDPNASGGDIHIDRKLFESSFQNTKDYLNRSYEASVKSPAVKACLVDPLIANGTKWILFNPRLEAHLTTVSLALEEA